MPGTVLLIIAVTATVVAYSAVVVGSKRSMKEQAYEDEMQSRYLIKFGRENPRSRTVE